jgi:DMSO/TMAO reductase YedYZ molybdopterin-dependent catalytic subunit
MHHRLTILAYKTNSNPLSVPHGAPLRLRCENELGFKMVKWAAAIEFVRDFSDLGAGEGARTKTMSFMATAGRSASAVQVQAVRFPIDSRKSRTRTSSDAKILSTLFAGCAKALPSIRMGNSKARALWI